MKTKVVEPFDQVRVWQIRHLYNSVMNVHGIVMKKVKSGMEMVEAPYRSVNKAREEAEQILAATEWTLASYVGQVRKYMGERMARRMELRFGINIKPK